MAVELRPPSCSGIGNDAVETIKYCLKEFEREMGCAICLSVCRDPRSLPCSHFYCAKCLDKAARGGNSECPKCKKQWKRRELQEDDTLLLLSVATRDLHDVLMGMYQIAPLSQDIPNELLFKQARRHMGDITAMMNNKRNRNTSSKREANNLKSKLPNSSTYPKLARHNSSTNETSSKPTHSPNPTSLNRTRSTNPISSNPTRSTNPTSAKRSPSPKTPAPISHQISKSKALPSHPLSRLAHIRTRSKIAKETKKSSGSSKDDILSLRKQILDLTGVHVRGRLAGNKKLLIKKLKEIKERPRGTRAQPISKRSSSAQTRTRTVRKRPPTRTGHRVLRSGAKFPKPRVRLKRATSKPRVTKNSRVTPYPRVTPNPRVTPKPRGKKHRPISATQSAPERIKRQRKNTVHHGMVLLDTWNCPQCTYRNKALEPACAVCDFERKYT